MYYFIIFAFIFAGLEALARWKEWGKLEYLTKPAVMLALFFYLFLSDLALPGGLRYFAAGIIFSLFGDIFLIFPKGFTGGLVMFLAAHLQYIVGFNTPFPQIQNFWAFAVAIVLALGAMHPLSRIVEGVRASGQKRLVLPVIVYSTVITLMLLSALLTLFRADWMFMSALLVSMGALLFYLSDIVLAWNKFVAPIKNGRLVNIGLYHLGQIALITGAVMQFAK